MSEYIGQITDSPEIMGSFFWRLAHKSTHWPTSTTCTRRSSDQWEMHGCHMAQTNQCIVNGRKYHDTIRIGRSLHHHRDTSIETRYYWNMVPHPSAIDEIYPASIAAKVLTDHDVEARIDTSTGSSWRQSRHWELVSKAKRSSDPSNSGHKCDRVSTWGSFGVESQGDVARWNGWRRKMCSVDLELIFEWGWNLKAWIYRRHS